MDLESPFYDCSISNKSSNIDSSDSDASVEEVQIEEAQYHCATCGCGCGFQILLNVII